jgi:purine-binding chemotaxis protein CheW
MPTASDVGATEGQYLTFGLAGGTFAIPILTVREIRGWEAVTEIPRAPAYVLGVMNLRGSVVPVLDLRASLGMVAQERTPTSVVIVVRVETADAVSRMVGCLVDHVSDVVTMSSENMRPAPDSCGDIESHFVAAVSTLGTELVLLLDLSRLVDSSIVPGGTHEAA